MGGYVPCLLSLSSLPDQDSYVLYNLFFGVLELIQRVTLTVCKTIFQKAQKYVRALTVLNRCTYKPFSSCYRIFLPQVAFVWLLVLSHFFFFSYYEFLANILIMFTLQPPTWAIFEDLVQISQWKLLGKRWEELFHVLLNRLLGLQ